MKRWNQKGSTHAKVRMAELRARKARLGIADLQRQFNTMIGSTNYADVMDAMKARGWHTGMTFEQRADWFRAQLQSQVA